MEEKKETKKVEVAKNNKTENKKGLCIASMVLGIVALVLFCVWIISVPCGILAIIFGIIGIKSEGKGMAIAGLITGGISFLLSFIIFMSLFIYGVTIGITQRLEDIDYEYNGYNYDYDYDDYDVY